MFFVGKKSATKVKKRKKRRGKIVTNQKKKVNGLAMVAVAENPVPCRKVVFDMTKCLMLSMKGGPVVNLETVSPTINEIGTTIRDRVDTTGVTLIVLIKG